jgi:protein gp37
VTSESYWKQALKWQRLAAAAESRRRVFCGSMCDWADKRAPAGQRDRLWQVIRSTPDLDWQLLTKRAPNIQRYLPDDWGNGYPNVWLGVTVEDRKHGLARLEVLKQVPAALRFLSMEPLLEDLGQLDLTGIAWVIAGGESGPAARPMDPEWVLNIQRQCQEQGVPLFFKQWGSRGYGKGGCILLGQEFKEWPRCA